MSGKVNKMAMFMLVLCVAVSMFSVNVFAADATTPIDSCDRIVESYDLDDAEDYINDGKTNTYPTCKTEGYLFAGWYTDEECGEDSFWGEQEPGDTVYALFVPSHVLGVKAQISSNLLDKDTKNDGTASIRFVTTVDTLFYRQAGFEVSYVGTDGTTKNATSASNKVYKKLYAIGSTSDEYTEEDVLKYTPEGTFCKLSTYFKACTVKNVGSDYFTTAFTVKPYVITMDGSKVYGDTVVKSINDYFLKDDVYVSSQMDAAADTVENGSAEKPFKTLEYALGMVANGGTIHVVDSYAATSAFIWKDHNKTVTITGGTINFTGVPTKTIGSAEETVLDINDSVTFTGTTLTFANGQHIYANGNSVELASDVTWGDSSAYVQIYGGAYNTTLNSDTNLVLSVGNYTRVVGGNNKGTLNGDTHVTLSGTINGALATNEVYKEHKSDYVVYAAGENDGKLNGDANLTIASENVYFQYVFGGGNSGAVKGDCHVTYTGKAMGVYGGGKSGKITGNTYFTMTGGWVEQVFGGCENADVEGNTNVNIQAGTVKRRVYGGCYNGSSSSTRKVMGCTMVSIDKGATLSLSFPVLSGADNSISSVSRNFTSIFKEETGVFIFNDYENNSTNIDKVGIDTAAGIAGVVSQTYNYFVRASSGGTVYGEDNGLRIVPDSGKKATVRIGSKTGTVDFYTESKGFYILPDIDSTAKQDIYVMFTDTTPNDVTTSDYEAKIDGAYYDTLEEAVDAAQVLESEDTITVTLLKNAEVEETMAITDSSNVEVEGASKYTINRADTMRDESIFTIEDGSTLTVDNVVLDGRTTTDITSNITDLDTLKGSASSLILNDGTVDLQNMTAQYAVKTEENGAVLQSWGKTDVVTVENSTFSYNKAPGQGAAIRMGGGTGKLEVSNSTFEYNEVYTLTSTEGETVSVVARGLGGAIGTHAEVASIDNCKFVGNTATGYATDNDACAGAIYSGTNSIVTMTGSDANALFSGNSVTNGHGGAVAAGSGKVTITGYTFEQNTSSGNGGVILSQGESTKIKAVSCKFEKNTATGSGGVAYVAGSGTLIFDKDADCAIEALAKNNEAGTNGGVTAQGSNTVIKVTGYKFEGNTAQYGGAIRVNSDALSATIKNTEFVSNTSTQPGGAIQSYSLLTVTGSTFTENTSGNAGGAIHNAGNDSSVNDCTFTSNKAGTHGGALCTDTAISIADSEFTSNNAGDGENKYGGAIYTSKNIEITIDTCGFTSNNATHGGAIYMGTGTVNITASEFKSNQAEWPGGGIYSNGSLTVTGTTFEENKTTKGIGGAVKLGGSANGQFEDADFIKNYAGNAGGAIHNEGKNVTIDVCTFEGNTSANSGGAINTNTTMTITDSTFTSNGSTNGNGGAFYNGQNVTHTITGCDFISGSAIYGGAIYLNAGTLTADDCEFYENTSSKEGGAIWTNASTTTIKNSTFGATDRGNTSETNGGALYIAETKTANVEKTTFKANSAVNGGAIECHNSTLNATSCHFIGNTATTEEVTGFAGRGGGAVNITGNAKATFDGTGSFESNTATTGQGGAIYTTDAELLISGYTFTSNSAKQAGAIMIDNVTEVTIPDNESTTDVNETKYDTLCTTEIKINDSKFIKNSSTSNGGAIYLVERTLNLAKTTTDAEALFDGNTANEGGAIWSNGSLSVNGFTFSANESKGVGGAIEHIGKAGTIKDTTFSNNVAGNAGGAIINKGTDTLVSGCIFTSNTSATNGGAICSDTAMTITNSNFTSNEASTYGGAFYTAKDVTIAINSGTFTGNNATQGGAIFDNAGSLEATGVTFDGNTSTGIGGAIKLGADGTLVDCEFLNNGASSAGGAIHNANAGTSISGCTFTSNTSATNGGAICSDTAMTMENSTFSQNIANGKYNKSDGSSGGGAFYTGQAVQITVKDCDFNSNKANGGENSCGGAICIKQGTLVMTDNNGSNFTSNTATHGGAIFLGSSSTGTINKSEFKSNESVWPGGGIYSNGTLTVTSSNFEENKAGNAGGAIKLDTNANGIITDCDFKKNKANNGGAIHEQGKSISLKECLFESNQALSGKGGAFNGQQNTKTIDSCTFTSNTATGDGKAIYFDTSGTLNLKNSIFNNFAQADIFINSNAKLNEENNTKNTN